MSDEWDYDIPSEQQVINWAEHNAHADQFRQEYLEPPEDVCPNCHEPHDCCACEHDKLVDEIANKLAGNHYRPDDLLAEAPYLGKSFTAEFGLLIEVTLANGKTYRIRVEEVASG